MNPGPTGYSLESVHTVQAKYRALLDDQDLPEERDISFRWDWRLIGPMRFEVMLAATIGPCSTGRDEMEAYVVGTFEMTGSIQSVDLLPFVSVNGPALLMPYLRQALTALSAPGPFGPFYLPPINVMALSEQFDTDAATGARQLQEDDLVIETPAAEGDE